MNIKKMTFAIAAVAVIIAMSLASCSQPADEPLVFNTEPPEGTIDLPYYVDLTDKKWLEAAYEPHPYKKWYVKETTRDTYDCNGNIVPVGTPVLLLKFNGKDDDTGNTDVPPGASTWLNIGGRDWTDYKFSFDFYLGGEKEEERYISFSAYNAVNGGADIINNGEYVARSVHHHFEFELSRSDGLVNSSVLSGRIRYMDMKDGLRVLPELDVWHSVTLELRGLSLYMIHDGEDLGDIVRYAEKPCGGITLDGSSNICYKNISIVPVENDVQ